ncbi:unnamed protein product [Owenia fusiformis]|uniref:Uncharacterized protein n=1 Tax=Owenia fusiformis TaxID=6347 RepID=A0A8J1TXH9_OWEFU|nr:unnamed protein product [Owenia fusiformis]
MDILEPGLDSGSQDKSPDHSPGTNDHHEDDGETEEGAATAGLHAANPGLALDPNIQYQFRADTSQGDGQVTYRVVQVAQGDGQVAATSTGFPAGTTVAQAVIQSPFSNGSPTPEQQERPFTYFSPTVAGAGDPGTAQVQLAPTAVGDGQVTLGQVSAQGGEGQFYVMMSPQDVLQGGVSRNIAPRTTFSPKAGSEGRNTRDERRRQTHNEVERRRRDKINNWIVQLSKLVPDCTMDSTKSGALTANSKGGVLAKACDYITELTKANARMAESLKDTERLSVDSELLRQQCEELKQENMLLRQQLQQHGIVATEINQSGT